MNNTLQIELNCNNISLFFRGQRLDISKKFSDYENIKNNVIIHCFDISNSSRQSHENIEISSEHEVSIYVLGTHSVIIFFYTILIIYSTK